MYLTGHNSYKGCHFCNIHGIYLNHVYFLTMLPMGKEHKHQKYDPDNLPLRTHRQFKDQIFQLNQLITEKERKKLVTEFGKHKYKYLSVICYLCLIDIMLVNRNKRP